MCRCLQSFQEITFHGHAIHDGSYESRSKTVENYITGEETTGCAAGQKDTMHVNLYVPSIPPTDLLTSTVVHIKYSIRVNKVLPLFLFYSNASFG